MSLEYICENWKYTWESYALTTNNSLINWIWEISTNPFYLSLEINIPFSVILALKQIMRLNLYYKFNINNVLSRENYSITRKKASHRVRLYRTLSFHPMQRKSQGWWEDITYFSREKGARMKETDVGDHVVYADDH
jgi:hypothetical protein